MGCGTSFGANNLINSQASINYQRAYSIYLDNRLKGVQVYFERRRMNASYRAEMRRPAPTSEEIAAFNKSRTPNRLSPEQLAPEQGSLRWPAEFDGTEFQALRTQLDGLFAERALHPYEAGLGTSNYRQIHQLTTEFHQMLKAMIDRFTPDEFITGNKFLNQLDHEARFVSARVTQG